MQEAEYEEPGKKTRATRSERTGKTKEAKAEREHRGSHCEAETGRKRKGRNRGRVARTGTEVDERKRKEREKARKREQKGSTGGTAVGAKPGGVKRNKQKAEYEEPGKKTWETRTERTGKSKEVERLRGSTEEATERQRQEERGKEETEAE